MGMSSLTGGGGLQSSAGGGGPSGTGQTSATSGTGTKNINIGGNPNVSQALSHPLILVGGAVLMFWLWRKYK